MGGKGKCDVTKVFPPPSCRLRFDDVRSGKRFHSLLSISHNLRLLNIALNKKLNLPRTAGKFRGAVSFSCVVRRRSPVCAVHCTGIFWSLRLHLTAKCSYRFVLKSAFNMVFRSALLTASKRMAMVATSQVRIFKLIQSLSP